MSAYTPATDPAYSAYLRSAGVDESDIQGELASRIDALQRQKSRKALQFNRDVQLGVEQAGLEAEGRGMFNSGRRHVNQQRVQDEVQMQQAEYEANQNDTISQLEQNAARQVAQLRRQTAEKSLAGYGDPNQFLPSQYQSVK